MEFDWPCDKRIAHGPHEVLVREYKDDSLFRDCPGVKAHPDTMIGRTAVPTRRSFDSLMGEADQGVDYDWPAEVTQKVSAFDISKVSIEARVHLVHPNFGEHPYIVTEIDAEKNEVTMRRV